MEASIRRGRIWVIGIFVALRAIEFGLYYATAASRSAWMALLLASVLWTTVLLIGIWFQRNWARYFLILALGASSVGLAITATAKIQEGDLHYTTAFILAMSAIGHAAIVCALAYSPDIKHLTNQARRLWFQ